MGVNSDDAAAEGSGSGKDKDKGKGAHCGCNEPQNPINPKPNPSSQSQPHSKPKNCKGSLYYSSSRQSKSKNPICVGFSGTLNNQFPPDTVRGRLEMEASKQGKSLANFRYACLGYSIYLDNENSSADSQNKKPMLPFCGGFEMLMIKKTPSVSPADHVTTSAHKTEEHERATPQPQSLKPPQVIATGKKNFNRFTRNASLVASGVARNVIRVGNYAKETLDGFLNSQRGGPK